MKTPSSILGRLARPSRPNRRVRLFVVGSWLASLFCLLFLAHGLPLLLRPLLVRELATLTDRVVELEAVEISPLDLRVALRGLLVRDETGLGTLAAFDRLDLQLDARSALSGVLRTRLVELVRPRVRIVHKGGGEFNFSDILPGPPRLEQARAEPSGRGLAHAATPPVGSAAGEKAAASARRETRLVEEAPAAPAADSDRRQTPRLEVAASDVPANGDAGAGLPSERPAGRAVQAEAPDGRRDDRTGQAQSAGKQINKIAKAGEKKGKPGRDATGKKPKKSGQEKAQASRGPKGQPAGTGRTDSSRQPKRRGEAPTSAAVPKEKISPRADPASGSTPDAASGSAEGVSPGLAPSPAAPASPARAPSSPAAPAGPDRGEPTARAAPDQAAAPSSSGGAERPAPLGAIDPGVGSSAHGPAVPVGPGHAPDQAPLPSAPDAQSDASGPSRAAGPDEPSLSIPRPRAEPFRLEGFPLAVALENLRIVGAEALFEDVESGARHRLRFDLDVPALSDPADPLGALPAATLAGDLDDAPFEARGQERRAGRSGVRVRLDGLDLARLAPLIPPLPGLAPRAGLLDLDAELRFGPAGSAPETESKLSPEPAPKIALDREASPGPTPQPQRSSAARPAAKTGVPEAAGQAARKSSKPSSAVPPRQDQASRPAASSEAGMISGSSAKTASRSAATSTAAATPEPSAETAPPSGGLVLSMRGEARLRQAGVDDGQGRPLLRLGALRVVDCDLDLASRRVSLGLLALEETRTSLVRDASGGFPQLAALLGQGAGKPGKTAAGQAGKPFSASLGELRLTGGRVECRDESVRPPFTAALERVDVTARGVEWPPRRAVDVSLRASTSFGESLALTGKIRLDPLTAEGAFEVKGLAPARYAPLYADLSPVRPEEGKASARCDYKLRLGADGPSVRLENLRASLEDVRLREAGGPAARLSPPASPRPVGPGGPSGADAPAGPDAAGAPDFLRLGALSLSGGSLSWPEREVVLGELEVSRAVVSAMREPGGLFQPFGRMADKAARPGPTPAGKPWLIRLGRAAARDCEVVVEDKSVETAPVLRFEGVTIGVKDFDSRGLKAAEVSLSAFRRNGGAFSVRGPLALDPLKARLETECRNVDVALARHYLPPWLRLDLRRGKADVRGAVALEAKTDGPPSVAFEGEMSLADVELADRRTGGGILAARSLVLTGFSVGRNPTFFDAREIRLSDFSASLRALKNGRLDLQEIMAEAAEGGATPDRLAAAPSGSGQSRLPDQPSQSEQSGQSGQPRRPGQTAETVGAGRPGEAARSSGSGGPGGPTEKDEVLQLRVDRLLFSGGKLNFRDEGLSPPWETTLSDLSGAVTGLNTGEVRPADVRITGRQNNWSPLEIKGKVIPLARNFLMDVGVVFKDVDMVQLSPYARRLIGHPIRKGKASLELRFLIEQTRLDSKNTLLLESVDVGDRVAGSNAPSLPLSFLIAVLEDGQGRINLDIPLAGDLASPEFSLRGVVAKFFADLFQKIALSPLAFLGLPFGGGQDAGAVEFGYGASQLPPASLAKLDEIARAVAAKPKLSVELSGYVDVASDRYALQENSFRLKLQERRFRDLAARGEAPSRAEELSFPAEEWDAYLRQAYAEERKARGDAGPLLTDAREIELWLRSGLDVSDEDLRAFALKRAVMARDRLVESGVEPGRVFLVSPETLEPPSGLRGKAGLARVQVRLK